MSWRERAAALLFVLAPAVAAAAAQAPAGEGWARVEPGLALRFPRDHGAHPAYRTEWWYLTGELEDAGGAAFGFQLTVFRNGLEPGPPPPGASPLRAREVYAGHLALCEVDAGRTRFAERLRRGGTPLAGASLSGLDVTIEDWSLAQGGDGALRARAADAGAGVSIDLSLRPTKPLVLHGADGYSSKGGAPGNASAYVSWTRLAAEGTLALDGAARPVRGEAWFDHEFGSSVLGEGVVGWDWFGLRLDDGRELMLFRLRGADGRARPASAGTLVAADGTSVALGADDFALEDTARWTSPRTGGEYPAAWRVRLPAHGLELELVPRVPDCELATGGSTGVVYWEGPVRVTGGASGSGYAELTGYAGTLAGRF